MISDSLLYLMIYTSCVLNEWPRVWLGWKPILSVFLKLSSVPLCGAIETCFNSSLHIELIWPGLALSPVLKIGVTFTFSQSSDQVFLFVTLLWQGSVTDIATDSSSSCKHGKVQYTVMLYVFNHFHSVHYRWTIAWKYHCNQSNH